MEIVLGAFYEVSPFPTTLPGVSAEVVVKDINPPQHVLRSLREGHSGCLLLVPGLDIYEWRGKNPYREGFEGAVLKAVKNLGKDLSVYIYIYPSFFKSMWESGRELARLVNSKGLSDIVVIAHSKGGLVVRVALLNEEFRRRVKTVYFLGTPHFGSPLANALIYPPAEFEKVFSLDKEKADKVRLALALSYTAGYINSIGSRELSWMNHALPPLENYEGIKYVLIAGMIGTRSYNEVLDYLNMNMKPDWFAPAIGLFYLSLISDIVFGKDPVFRYSDGLVPVESALALRKLRGKKVILWGYNHARLMLDEKIMEKIINGAF